jgi:hypothetical protein
VRNRRSSYRPFTITADPDGCDAPVDRSLIPTAMSELRHPHEPSSGTHTYTMFARSQRDADDDGMENTLDYCPLIPSPGFNPRAPD